MCISTKGGLIVWEHGWSHLVIQVDESWAPPQRCCTLERGEHWPWGVTAYGWLMGWAYGAFWSALAHEQELDQWSGLLGKGGRSALLLQSWALGTAWRCPQGQDSGNRHLFSTIRLSSPHHPANASFLCFACSWWGCSSFQEENEWKDLTFNLCFWHLGYRALSLRLQE